METGTDRGHGHSWRVAEQTDLIDAQLEQSREEDTRGRTAFLLALKRADASITEALSNAAGALTSDVFSVARESRVSPSDVAALRGAVSTEIENTLYSRLSSTGYDALLASATAGRDQSADDISTALGIAWLLGLEDTVARRAVDQLTASGYQGATLLDRYKRVTGEVAMNLKRTLGLAAANGASVNALAKDWAVTVKRARGALLTATFTEGAHGFRVGQFLWVETHNLKGVTWQWHLSALHPKRDVCDEYNGRVFSDEQIRKLYPAHDNCLCYLEAVPDKPDTPE